MQFSNGRVICSFARPNWSSTISAARNWNWVFSVFPTELYERLLGEGNLVKGAIRRIQLAIQKKPKIAFESWKRFIEDYKRKKFYDNARSLKLKLSMTRITTRSKWDAFLRIAGGGNKFKGLLYEVISDWTLSLEWPWTIAKSISKSWRARSS